MALPYRCSPSSDDRPWNVEGSRTWMALPFRNSSVIEPMNASAGTDVMPLLDKSRKPLWPEHNPERTRAPPSSSPEKVHSPKVRSQACPHANKPRVRTTTRPSQPCVKEKKDFLFFKPYCMAEATEPLSQGDRGDWTLSRRQRRLDLILTFILICIPGIDMRALDVD